MLFFLVLVVLWSTPALLLCRCVLKVWRTYFSSLQGLTVKNLPLVSEECGDFEQRWNC